MERMRRRKKEEKKKKKKKKKSDDATGNRTRVPGRGAATVNNQSAPSMGRQERSP